MHILSLLFLAFLLLPLTAIAGDPTVVTLTQVPCQFLETEADRGFSSAGAEDCVAINDRTQAERMKTARVMELSPGDYVFKVANKNVPYELGFWLREAGYDEAGLIKQATMTSVSGGGLTPGTSRDYAVTLKPGDYLFSCPLNPTPDYRLVVK